MVRTIIVFIVFGFSFCFCVNAIAAEGNKEITVFGVTLGKTFAAAGIKECKVKEENAYKYGKSKIYDKDTDCYQYTSFGENVCLTYINKELSFFMIIEAINSTKCDIESPIEEIIARFNSDDYDKALSLVTGKFGKPQKTNNISVSNKLGAKFNKTENTWSIKGNYIYLTNMHEKIDEGMLTIAAAKRVQREADKTMKNRQSDQQKF